MNDDRVLQLIDSDPDGDAPGETPGGHAALTPIPRQHAERVAGVLKAVADPTRLQLLAMIQSSPGGEACVNDLTGPLGLTQPTVSHHLKILVDAGLITRDKRGVWAWYAIAPGKLDTIQALLA